MPHHVIGLAARPSSTLTWSNDGPSGGFQGEVRQPAQHKSGVEQPQDIGLRTVMPIDLRTVVSMGPTEDNTRQVMSTSTRRQSQFEPKMQAGMPQRQAIYR